MEKLESLFEEVEVVTKEKRLLHHQIKKGLTLVFLLW